MSIAKLEHEARAHDTTALQGAHDGAPDGSRRLRVVHDREQVNLPAAERAVRDLLLAQGRDPSSPHLADTPRRVATSFLEMLTPREFDLTTFSNDEHYDELVLAKSIPAQSLRGVQAIGSRTITSSVHGLLREDARSRQEFFTLTRGF